MTLLKYESRGNLASISKEAELHQRLRAVDSLTLPRKEDVSQGFLTVLTWIITVIKASSTLGPGPLCLII